MKYVLIDCLKDGDMFTEEFDSRMDAHHSASSTWDSLSDYDKKRRESFYVIESADPNEESESHFDGDVLYEVIDDVLERIK